MAYLRGQINDPYVWSDFDDRNGWYCTKLPWVGYWEYHNVNIHEWDFSMYYCYPDNIYDDDDTIVFASGS